MSPCYFCNYCAAWRFKTMLTFSRFIFNVLFDAERKHFFGKKSFFSRYLNFFAFHIFLRKFMTLVCHSNGLESLEASVASTTVGALKSQIHLPIWRDRQSTEEALALLTRPSQVRILAVQKLIKWVFEHSNERKKFGLVGGTWTPKIVQFEETCGLGVKADTCRPIGPGLNPSIFVMLFSLLV